MRAETAPLQYLVAPREPLDADVPSSCLSQAVFSARLVSVSSDDTPDDVDTQTLAALDRPARSADRSSYFVSVPPDLAVPPGRYQLDVHLAFGFYLGVLDGAPCGEVSRTCDESALSAAQGEQLRYVGERVEVVSGQVVELGRGSTLLLFPWPLSCTL